MPSDEIPHNVLHATSSSIVFWWIGFKCHYLSTERFWVLQNPSASMSIGDLIITQWTRKSFAPVLRSREEHSVLEGLQLEVEPWSEAPCWPCHGRASWKCWDGWCKWSTLLPSGCHTDRQLLVCFCLSVKYGPPACPLPLNEVPMPRHLLLLAALMEFRAKRRWEVRHSSEEHKVVWKKSVLLSYLKNIIKSWKKQQRGFFVLFLSPSPFQVWRPPGFPLPRIQSHKVGPSL